MNKEEQTVGIVGYIGQHKDTESTLLCTAVAHERKANISPKRDERSTTGAPTQTNKTNAGNTFRGFGVPDQQRVTPTAIQKPQSRDHSSASPQDRRKTSLDSPSCASQGDGSRRTRNSLSWPSRWPSHPPFHGPWEALRACVCVGEMRWWGEVDAPAVNLSQKWQELW